MNDIKYMTILEINIFSSKKIRLNGQFRKTIINSH